MHVAQPYSRACAGRVRGSAVSADGSPAEVILWRSGSIPIIKSCYDVETAAVEAVDAARDCGGQRPRIRRVS